jgi:hypothetical protein
VGALPDLGVVDPTQAILPLVAPSHRLPTAPIELELTVDDGRATTTDTVRVRVVAVGGLDPKGGCRCVRAGGLGGGPAAWVGALALLGLERRRRRASLSRAR